MPEMNAQRLYARTHTSGRTKSVQDAPTTNDHDCRDAKPTERSLRGKGVSDFREIVRFLEGLVRDSGFLCMVSL